MPLPCNDHDRRNMNLAKAPATYYDKPEGSKATTWDHVLKADNVKRLTFAGLDKNCKLSRLCKLSALL